MKLFKLFVRDHNVIGLHYEFVKNCNNSILMNKYVIYVISMHNSASKRCDMRVSKSVPFLSIVSRAIWRAVKYNTLASSSWVMYFLIEHKIIRTTIVYS